MNTSSGPGCMLVEDHHLYSLNYMHFGDPKIWYGVPGNNACKFEDGMKKHLPKLLMNNLVCFMIWLHSYHRQFSNLKELKEFQFIVRFKNQENLFSHFLEDTIQVSTSDSIVQRLLAPIDWLPHGQSAIELYREHKRKTSISHDKLLFCTVRQAVKELLEITLFEKNSSDNLKWKIICEDGVFTSAVKWMRSCSMILIHIRSKFLMRSMIHVHHLHYGTVEPGKHWCSKEAIFPKGFRSQVEFIRVLNPTTTCFYVSKILDARLLGSLFKVNLFFYGDPEEVKENEEGDAVLAGPDYGAAAECQGMGTSDQWGGAGVDWNDAATLVPAPVPAAATEADWGDQGFRRKAKIKMAITHCPR